MFSVFLSKSINSDKAVKTAPRPTIYEIFDDKLYANTTCVAYNPAYESVQGDQGDENPYEALR